MTNNEKQSPGPSSQTCFWQRGPIAKTCVSGSHISFWKYYFHRYFMKNVTSYWLIMYIFSINMKRHKLHYYSLKIQNQFAKFGIVHFLVPKSCAFFLFASWTSISFAALSSLDDKKIKKLQGFFRYTVFYNFIFLTSTLS